MPSEEIDRDEEEQEEEVEPMPPPKPTARVKTKKNGVAAAVGSGVQPKRDNGPGRWTSNEAELQWPEIIEWLESTGHSPFEVDIQVVRLSPAGPEGAMPVGHIDGNAVVGDGQVSAGDRLIRFITEQFHMPTQRGPARYEVRFNWKVGAQRIGRATLNLPSPAEIIALRNASYAAQTEQPMPQNLGAMPQRQQQPQYAPQQPPQYAQPPQQQPYYPYGPPPYGYGYAPPGVYHEPAPVGVSPDVSALQAELARTQGAMNEMMRAWREGKAPPPGGVAAPSDAITQKVNALESKFDALIAAINRTGSLGGVGNPPPAVAAPPAATGGTADEMRGMVDGVLKGMMRMAVDTFNNNVQKSIKTAMGMGLPPVEDASAEIAEPAPEESMKPPFDVADVADTKWPDGSPVKYAADRESGDISPMGLAFGNPYVVGKAMDMANGLTEALTGVLKGMTQTPIGAGRPQQPPQVPPAQVVREIPTAAKDATVEAPPTNDTGFPEI